MIERNENSDRTDITELLKSDGRDGIERALPHVYQELCLVASAYLRKERGDHTLQTGDLVHEVYMRLQSRDRADWRSRKHFLVVAADAMRRYLIDYARRHNADKRNGDGQPTLTLPNLGDHALDIMDLERALVELEQFDEDLATIVKLRFFAGLPTHEIGPVLNLSPMAVSRRWWQAKQWLKVELMA